MLLLDTTYVVDTIQEGSVITFYLYEKGADRTQALFTYALEDVSWIQTPALELAGGSMFTTAYDREERVEYDITTGDVLRHEHSTGGTVSVYEYDTLGDYWQTYIQLLCLIE